MSHADFLTATEHHRAGRLGPAEKLYQQILASEPGHVEARGQLGYLYFQTGRNELAVEFISRAVGMKPGSAVFQNNLGMALAAVGRVGDAIGAYRLALELRPGLAEIHNNLGNALLAAGRREEGIGELRAAWRLRPDVAEIYDNLAKALEGAGRFGEAEEVYRQVLLRNPESAEAYTNLGVFLHGRQRWEEAIAVHRRAVELRPEFPQALFNLGAALKAAGKLDEAIVAYRGCLTLRPKFPAALNNLANALRDIGELDAALEAYRQSSEAAAEEGVEYDPPETNRLYTLYFSPKYSAGDILREHLEWNRRRAAPLGAGIAAHVNDRSPGRRIRIGYVSPDLRDHPVGLALEPLLENHDHREFEIVCFSNSETVDAVTERLRAHADRWLPIASLSEERVAEMVRGEKIDILVDLSLHMAHNRLLVFARRPAPIQVTYLGYPGTTGLGTMDYRLSDPYLDPMGTDGDYSERTVRLPATYICWRWSGAEEGVQRPPAESSGYVTFGSLNTFCKVTGPVLEAWGKLMSEVKDSRLILRCPAGEAAKRVREALGRHGISADRIELTGRLPWAEYVKLCQRQDIGLDPFPYPGHTTSLDSLWLGVPMVTLRGGTAVGRGGASILSNLGLGELIADTEEEYIRIARDLAGDWPRLAGLRWEMRERIERSPLVDAGRFARDVEEAYRGMWREWCSRTSAV